MISVELRLHFEKNTLSYSIFINLLETLTQVVLFKIF